MFTIKIYNSAGVFIRTIQEMNDISFTSQMNGGQGEVRIETKDEVANYSGYRVKIYRTLLTQQTLVYSGIIGKISHIIDTSREYYELVALGLSSILKDILFSYGGTYSFSRNGVDISEIVANIIDAANLVYPGIFNYSATTIINTGTIVSLTFLYDNCYSAIVRVSELSEYYWYIDENGTVFFKPRSGTPEHLLTVGKNVSSLSIEYDSENIINDYHLAWASGTENQYNWLSIALYGKRSKYEQKTQITAGAAQVALTYVLENSFPKQKVNCSVNSNIDFFAISPGEVIQIANIEATLSLQVQRISYNRNEATIDLEEFQSLSKEILK